jgi:sugar phosphate isomerase/epimerase
VEQATERIVAFVPELEAAGVTLAIENHDRFRAAQFASIVAGVNSPRVGICLDTANSFGSLEGPDVVFDTLLPLTANLHLKDFAVHRFPDNMGFEIIGTPAGEGRLDCPSLIRRLYDLRPDANVILELWPRADADVESTIRKEESWVRQSIAYLRPLIPA